MKFGPVPTAQALGAILAHSQSVGGHRIRKGRVLRAADIAMLRAAGVDHVTVAQMEPGDVHEDAAALRLAQALVGDAQGLELQSPHTGRVNVLASQPGLAALDVAAIHGLNRINPLITLATVPPWHRMDPKGMVATIKIISYAVPKADLTRACDIGAGALQLALPQRAKPVLIQTTVGDDRAETGHEAIERRLAALGMSLPPKIIVPHRVPDLSRALQAQSDADLILILTGSATSDPADVAPAAVQAAGGVVDHFGMPVDPGNLLFLGHFGPVPVIGLPGCARSPALNGADWVMERVICGQPVTGDDIMTMGVGGLLKEIPTRPQPRRNRA